MSVYREVAVGGFGVGWSWWLWMGGWMGWGGWCVCGIGMHAVGVSTLSKLLAAASASVVFGRKRGLSICEHWSPCTPLL